MPRTHLTTRQIDGCEVIDLENDQLRVRVAPGVGGRVVGLFNKSLKHEFLWKNPRLRLQRHPPGAEYDPNFYGGIDELLPNDMAETVDGLNLSDHGELWTAALDWRADESTLRLSGRMPVSGLQYERTMRLADDTPEVRFDYRITNSGDQRRRFLWKLHAAIAIIEGDCVVCPARTAKVVDPAWTRWQQREPFAWPNVDGGRADVIPPNNGTVDFLYLYDLNSGHLAWQRPSAGLELGYSFDTAVFPFVWYFASYGGFDGHYTAVLEPCTSMPMSLNEAIGHGRCSELGPGQSLQTSVTLYAGSVRRP